MLQSKIFQIIMLAVLAFLTFGLWYWGYINGQKTAKSEALIKSAQTIQQGFEFFHQDQNRYPNTLEFSDLNLMQNYITNFPPQEFPTQVCQTNFDYYAKSEQSYELRICLPKANGLYKSGWNVISKTYQVN